MSTIPSPLGGQLPHESALRHTSGEAAYTDDLPHPRGLLHAVVVAASEAHAKIVGTDAEAALKVPGVHAVLFASDIPGENNVGPVIHDEPALADGVVHCVGQAVGVVIAETREAARVAAERVVVTYEKLPAIIDIHQGIEAKAFHGETHVIERGDVAGKLAAAPHKLSGSVSSGGQDHFYLETHCAMAVPGEDRTLHVTSSTQHPSEVQTLVAGVLGLGRHRVVVECPRMGGAFGGKETQAAGFAAMAALGAYHTGRPVKCWLDRDTDMANTGRRHPFFSTFEVGFDDKGVITALDAHLFSDGGWAHDLSLAIIDRGLFHLDNGYWLPNVRIEGRVVRTNRSSNTAFRGFGGPQGMIVVEQIIERIAAHLNVDPIEVRRANYYRGENNKTPYGQTVEDFRLPRITDELVESSEIIARRAEVEAFNKANRFRKRAIAFSPVKFGISFTASFLNQAGAYVVLYADGTAQVNHGGTEMGQGLYTKMLVVCAHALGIPLGSVRHMPTSTDKVPNTSATAASSGADLNGAAVRNACDQLVERMRPVAADMLGVGVDEVQLASHNPERPLTSSGQPAWAWHGTKHLTLAEVAGQAYFRQVSLAASGFYKTPDIAYDRKAGKGKPFHYFAYGASVSEVEVDGLTGQWRLRRVDILQDVGDSLSHDIDVGQVEGAYVQGLGWLTWEELVFDDRGFLISHSPSTYKIPAIGDIPQDFRVNLLQRAEQPDVIFGSKAVGEPPFMLANSTHIALERAARAFGTHDTQLAIPATNEAIAFAVQRAKQGTP